MAKVNAKFSTPDFIASMTWDLTDQEAEIQSTYQAACDGVAPGFHPRVPTLDLSKTKSSKPASNSTKEFTDAMNWQGGNGTNTATMESNYQAACEITHPGFQPKPPPTPFDEEEKTEGQGNDDDDDDSTVAPLYYAWSSLPPPKGKGKGKSKRSKITKQATKPRPKNVVFESAADALNPVTTKEERSISDDYVIVENLDIEIDENKEAEFVLPLSTFETGPSTFFVTPEEAWKVKAVSESKSKYKWTPGHVNQSMNSVKESKLGKNIANNNDVTSQRVFTFRGAKKVLERCKKEQKEKAREPTQKMMKDVGSDLGKKLLKRRSSVEMASLNILPTADPETCHYQMNSDAVARRRNSSVELTRMLESRPQFLPDGRSKPRLNSAEVIEKALESRPDIEELKEKNIVQDHEEEKIAEKGRARRQSISLIENVLTKEIENKENKQELIKELKKPKPTKKPRAVIPERQRKATMQNYTNWNMAGGKNYQTETAAMRRQNKVFSMKAERAKAHTTAEKDAKIAPERYFGKYGKREVWAPRYPSGVAKMDRKKSEYQRNFVWPGYIPE
ncbi:hypothetical protein TrLO_g10619 [Triparma laevis f. longispina]|uniref:Uncharacterized protein n=1 Tax=Triparma laevis f. longispina TaxID=1714387 RepID=A0A9W7F923_9STRA|nr:hypothetical protein TrLO_g10619 [Triparma laevis f. longispina]